MLAGAPESDVYRAAVVIASLLAIALKFLQCKRPTGEMLFETFVSPRNREGILLSPPECHGLSHRTEFRAGVTEFGPLVSWHHVERMLEVSDHDRLFAPGDVTGRDQAQIGLPPFFKTTCVVRPEDLPDEGIVLAHRRMARFVDGPHGRPCFRSQVVLRDLRAGYGNENRRRKEERAHVSTGCRHAPPAMRFPPIMTNVEPAHALSHSSVLQYAGSVSDRTRFLVILARREIYPPTFRHLDLPHS